MKKAIILFVVLVSLLAIGCSNVGGLLTQSYTKPFITIKDQVQLRLGMPEKEVQELLGFPIEIALGYDSSKTELYSIWTYILRYPVFYPSKEGEVSHIKIKMTGQFLYDNPLVGFAEEQYHKFVFINGFLVAFGNSSEIGAMSFFSLSHNSLKQ